MFMHNNENQRESEPQGEESRAAEALVVSADPVLRFAVEVALGGMFESVASVRDVLPVSSCGRFEVVIVDVDTLSRPGIGLEPIAPLGTAFIVIGRDESAAELRTALRLAAHDVVARSASPSELRDRIARARERARSQAADALAERRRHASLRRTSAELDRGREELSRHMERLCEDLALPRGSLSQQVRDVAMASELNALLRQELELEGLLRTTLEYANKRLRHANAAIFLTEPSGDFSLGAYVNYDCPRETAEALLEEMAGSLAPRVSSRSGVVALAGEEPMREMLGGACRWLDDSAVCACACVPNGDCVGVVTFFRDRRTPFTPVEEAAVALIAGLFGRQLSRVVKTHSRHKPADAWDADLAA
jgi:DNA-binding response OmpR family regulator